MAGDSEDSTLFSNRSAAYLALGLLEQAFWDAKRAVALNPTWPKSYYRLGCAAMALNQWGVAVKALKQGLDLAKKDQRCQKKEIEDIQSRLKEAEERSSKNDKLRRAAAATERRGLLLRLRDARKQDQALAMLNQFKQSMAAPDWELVDLEWRPTWTPSMRLAPISSQNTKRSQQSLAILNFLTALSDLASPKAALRILADHTRFTAYREAIEKVACTNPGGFSSALVMSAGGGVLPILAARALLRSLSLKDTDTDTDTDKKSVEVIDFERSKMLYRMAKQVLEVNAENLPNNVNVSIIPQPLHTFLSQQNPLKDFSIGFNSSSLQHGDQQHQHNGKLLVITDLMDHTGLGMGLLPTLDLLSTTLSKVDMTIIPSRIHIKAMLMQVKLPDRLCGFDLSSLDAAYRWYPGDERVVLDELIHKKSHGKPLSDPFHVTTLDLQSRLQSPTQVPKSKGGWEEDFEVEVVITEAGWWNAVAFWFELDLDGNQGIVQLSTYSASHSRSWGQAMQYIDGREVSITNDGSETSKRVRVRRDVGQIVFTPTDLPSARLRHNFAPRWHFDMVQDEFRNTSYDRAIRSAVEKCRQRKKQQKFSNTEKVSVLDMGAGTGLLSMMAARAGADQVYAAEVSGHMCDVAEDVTITNGFLGKILVLDRDVRRMDVYRKPDGTAPELPHKVDLAVFELFDNGLIGEGVLHCLAAAKAKLLTPDAILVPAEATVYAQPIQWRSWKSLEEVEGPLSLRPVQQRWWTCAGGGGGDYEGVDLRGRHQEWVALAEAQEVFHFNFYDIPSGHLGERLEPESKVLDFFATSTGECNAIAMWFTLRLDDETTISTSPYMSQECDHEQHKKTTWQPAVQWLDPWVKVTNGSSLRVVAEHDTYSIKFAVDGVGKSSEMSNDNAMAEADPVWMAQYKALQPINAQLVKACVQNPLEFRAAALAAVQFAARPHDFGLDASQAAEFCTRMMG